MTSRWNYLPLTAEEQKLETELARRFANVAPISELLVQRGISSVAEAEKFFHPSLRDLHDPFLMPDMDKAVDRLNRAMGSKERIMVYGDYDVDGTTAVSLVYRYLQNFYSEIEYYIPTRYDDGYGISKAVIDEADERDVKLIIILDCGIKAIEEIRYAREKGIDFIICDHHVPDDELPPAVAILNPKMEGSTYPCPHLSGCGVGYKLMQAFSISNGIGTAELESMLDLVAVSIAADIVPMVDENRVMAYHGLKRLNTNPNMGLRAIIRTCGLGGKEITISDVIFKIGPRINASGRMENGKLSVQLLVENNPDTAVTTAKEIDEYNDLRRDIDKQMTEEANVIVERLNKQENRQCIVVYDENWKKGVVGIVAARLTDMYFRPTVVLTRDGDYAVGSARSVAGFDIYSAIKSCRDLLVNFGGHTFACGLTIRWNDVDLFKQRIEEYVSRHIQPTQTVPTLNADATINFSDINRRMLHDLKRFAPFGPGNTKPVFITNEVYDFGTSKVVGRQQEHLKLELVDSNSPTVMNGIAFGLSSVARYIKSRRSFNVLYTIEENVYRRGNVQLQIDDIHIGTKS